jgi:flagella basal body P-ring formation protein FlgA
MLVADIMVRRGQMVTLIVKSGQMYIRMAGRALSDGALNQRIRVENSNSQRVVEGVVRSTEYVEILVR